VTVAERAVAALPRDQRAFLFVNVSALHQPNCIFTAGAMRDSKETMAAALAYVDSCLPALFQSITRRAPTLVVICSDHGTAYGEDGYEGHRLAHPVVWTVPYAEFVLRRGWSPAPVAEASERLLA
jgi:membrane-anchored protein YejM (alkaline phosphatase superfamily)